jgi:transcriptional regulator with XRE-family HTH domain
MPDSRLSLIGMALRDARDLRGLTQDELAKMAAVSRSTIVSYEQVAAKSRHKLSEVLEALELPEDILWEFVEIYEAMSARLTQEGGEPGRTVLDRLLERKATEQSVYPQGSGVSAMELAEGGAAGIDRVVRAGAQFLSVFLSWMFDSFSPRSKT